MWIFYDLFGIIGTEVILLKKFLIYILLTSYIFGKNFTLFIGVENSGDFKTSFTTDANPRIDIEFLNHEKKIGIGIGSGINYVNIDKNNYLMTTNISLNTALNLINSETYSAYAGLNIGYSYPFVTVYHLDNNLDFIKTNFYYEFKIGAYYNDFNINIGLSTIFLDKSVNNVQSSDSLSRLSINGGFLLF